MIKSVFYLDERQSRQNSRSSLVKVLAPGHQGLIVVFDKRLVSRTNVRIGKVAFRILVKCPLHGKQTGFSRHTRDDLSKDLVSLLVIFIAVVTNGIREQKSLVRSTSSQIRVSQEQVDVCQFQVDKKAVRLFFDQVEQFREGDEKLSEIIVLNL